MDNGGAAAKVLDMITDEGNEYLTRVRINRSDLKNTESLKDSMIYVGMNAACIMRTFASSRRTTYLYFSLDSFVASIARAERALAEKERKRKEAQKILEEGDALKLVTVPNSPFYKVVVNETVLVMTLDSWVELNRNAEMKDAIPTETGWFKLECSFPMDPRLVLVIHRHRVSIEYTISVLKSVINLNPMRVWNSDAIRGKLVIGMINQFLITNLIRDLEPRTERRIIDGKPVDVRIRPSEKLVVKTLGRYEGVAESYEWGGFRVEGLPDPGLTEEIAKVFDRYDGEGR